MQLVEELILESRENRRYHLRLDEPCIERGGNSTNHKGVLAQFLNTNIPSGMYMLLCHACHNGACSNPRHLYWGTPKDNHLDAKEDGSYQSFWDRMVKKHGLEEARRIQSRKADMSKVGRGNLGKKKSEEHKRKISEALKNRARV